MVRMLAALQRTADGAVLTPDELQPDDVAVTAHDGDSVTFGATVDTTAPGRAVPASLTRAGARTLLHRNNRTRGPVGGGVSENNRHGRIARQRKEGLPRT